MNHSELLVWANSSFREDYQVPLLKAQQLDMHLQSQSGEMVLYVETWETGGYQTHNCHLTYTTKGLCIPGNIEVKIWLGSLSKAGLKGIFNPDLSLVIPSETEARKIRPDMPNVEIENVTKRLARAKQYPLVLALDTLPQVYSELRLRTLLEEINESSGKLLRRDLNSKFPYLRHEIFSYLTLENCGFKADLRQKKVEEIGISEGTFLETTRI